MIYTYDRSESCLHSLAITLLSLVAKVLCSELQLLVADPEDDVPADQPQAGGFKASVESLGSLCPRSLLGAVQDPSVLTSGTVHKPSCKYSDYERYSIPSLEKSLATIDK